jgi:hypothetical protein
MQARAAVMPERLSAALGCSRPSSRDAPHHRGLSSGNHLRYTYTQAALPIPTPSSARHIGIGRVGDDL